MRSVILIVIYLQCLLPTTVSYSQQPGLTIDHPYTVNSSVCVTDLIIVTPSTVLTDPYSMLNTWLEKPLSVDLYSKNERKIQLFVNEHTSNEIVSLPTPENKNEWSEIDFEPITPYTWKWIHLELVNDDGSHSTAQLRRPNWWIKKMKADKVGNQVYLDLPQMGMQGMSTVASIRINQYDSRFIDKQRNNNFSIQPITGKFTHQSENVYHIYFDNDKSGLGVTGSHLLWSSDSNSWIPVQRLKPGERIKTHSGIAKIKTLEKQNGSMTVYNLEVYRNHNYYASPNSVLAHNECWNASWDKVLSDWRKIAYDAGGPHGWASARTENGVRRVMLNYEHALGDLGIEEIPNIVRLEERTAIGEGTQAIILKIMMPSEIYQTDNLIISDLLKSGHYKDIRFYSEHGMNWVEGTKGNIPTTPTPLTNQDVPSTIPVR